jgi:hypothetical protein
MLGDQLPGAAAIEVVHDGLALDVEAEARFERLRGAGPPVVVAPPPTDAKVIAGTILGVASMFARGRY